MDMNIQCRNPTCRRCSPRNRAFATLHEVSPPPSPHSEHDQLHYQHDEPTGQSYWQLFLGYLFETGLVWYLAWYLAGKIILFLFHLIMPFFRNLEEIIPIADVVNQIIEAAGIGFVVIQMPLHTYVNLGLPSQPGELPVLQPSQFLPVHLANAVSLSYDICSNATNSNGLHFRTAFDEWDEKHYNLFGSSLVYIAAGYSYDWSFKELFMNHAASPILYMSEEINAIANYMQFISEPDPRNQLSTIKAMSGVAEALSWTRHHVLRLGKGALILKQWVEPVIEAATQAIQPLEECAVHAAKTNK